jgi:hypothetical protein
MPGMDDAARDEVRLTLQVLPRWMLNGEGWDVVEVHLLELKRALETDDRSGVFRQLERLDDLAPSRLGRLDADDDSNSTGGVVPPPPVVVELVNTLVHPPATGWR